MLLLVMNAVVVFALYSGARSVKGRILNSDWIVVSHYDRGFSLWGDRVRPRGVL